MPERRGKRRISNYLNTIVGTFIGGRANKDINPVVFNQAVHASRE
jgi:hypothetical protein